MDLTGHDVVLVTLDSCRYDTAVAAQTPNLDRLSRLLRAETSGTYTLPAHTAFFTGNLPRPLEGGYPLGPHTVAAIWRSMAARPTSRTVGIDFNGRTLMDHYRASGFTVIGAGGVTFFDPAEPNNCLPGLFDQFHYFGRTNRDAGSPAARVASRSDNLTLTHAAELGRLCRGQDRFFLFVNCPSTHIPYTTPDNPLTPAVVPLLERLYELHDSKRSDPAAFSEAEVGVLLGLQRQALEWADRQLGSLFGSLAGRRVLVVVCADHGDEFGEAGRYGHAHAHPTITTVPLWCGLLGR
ncbi:sulfatase-like hydrolase/transferase [Dactylosporangium sp. CA-152071]|uniref:sulfatase-like hydrolase/transferase n=1 Tax=Dactylosporangium sp. CA-152071 TaxID=3239933 RepID=UPI003D8A9CC6